MTIMQDLTILRITKCCCHVFQRTSGQSARNKTGNKEQTWETPREDEEGDKTREENPGDSLGDEEEEWESEAHKLYEWTQELSIDELAATPRLSAMSLTTSH